MKKILIIILLAGLSTALILGSIMMVNSAKTVDVNLTARAQDAPTAAAISDVQNLRVKEVGNKSITLEWDAVPGAQSYKILYGTKSVGDNEEYNRPAVDTDSTTTKKIDALSNGIVYYFSVIAVNGDQHSEYYSNEVSATPSSEGNLAAPTISSVTPVSDGSFEIKFSKSISLPENAKNEIRILKAFDETPLTVLSVSSKSPDTILVNTDKQSIGSEYRINLSDKFKDSSGVALDPMERQDIFIGFTGSAPNLGAEESADLKIKEIKNVNDKSVEIIFTSGVKLGAKPTDQIAILESENPDSILEVRDVIANTNDATKILVVTDTQKSVNYTILISGITDDSGKTISQANSTFTFKGFGMSSETKETDSTGSSEPTKDVLPETGPAGLLYLLGASLAGSTILRKVKK